jgi:glycosyltransferase involved in cell wall biosynthesis
MTIKAAMYYPWIYLKGGIERTILELARRSHHEWTVITNRYLEDETFPEFRDIEVVQLAAVSLKRKVFPVATACLRLLLTKQDWSRYDVVVVSVDGLGNLVTFRNGDVPLVCLCHTPLKIAYDEDTHDRWLEMHQPGIATRAAVRLFTAVDKRAWHRYRRIFCVSREVQRRLLTSGVPAQSTEVLHPGVDVDRFSPTGRQEPIFLLPGRIMWTKNIELGIEAFIRLKNRLTGSHPGARLVVAGMVDEKSAPYLAQMRTLAAGRADVEIVTSPSDERLLDLYDRCLAVLFTPRNEDWGIVPIEAMAFGKPVVAVDRGGPAESIVHGETGYLCEPSPEAFADAMSRILADDGLYDRMSVQSRRRAGEFTWDRFVGRIDDYLAQFARDVPTAWEAG